MKELISSISLNSFLYAIIVFVSIWSTLQIDGYSIPFLKSIYWGTGVLVFFLHFGKENTLGLKNNHAVVGLLLLLLMIYIIKVLNDPEYANLVEGFLSCVLLSFVFDKGQKKELLLSKTIFLSFFIVNCIIAIYERSIMEVVFWKGADTFLRANDMDAYQFRSAALTGHPVLSGFVTTIILCFIQKSELKTKTKYIFTLLGIFALLCFNSRTNIIISSLISITLFLNMDESNIYKKAGRFLLGGIAVAIFVDLLLTTEWGGRLTSHEIGKGDESTMARIETLQVFLNMDFSELLLGDMQLAETANMLMSLNYIENGYILLILEFGLILGLPFVYLLTKFQWDRLGVYKKYDKYIIFFMFVLVACTNPHLENRIPFVIWLLSYYMLRPFPANIKN